jgi:hypothetical protein
MYSIPSASGAYGVIFEVEDTKPDPGSPTKFAMKIQVDGQEHRREFKILSQLNSDKIIRLRKGRVYLWCSFRLYDCVTVTKLSFHDLFTDCCGRTDGVAW